MANPEKRAISVNFVREALLKSGADNVILLLDACRTEGDRSDGIGIGEAQPGAITIFSCQRHRKAYEIEALQQGAFTSALLEALRMPGERNCATVERLDLYLRDRVPQLCQLHNKPEQVPMTLVEPRQKSYLILLPQFATDRDIAMLREEAKDAELDENLDFAEQLWIRVIAATQGRDLRAIQAYARVQKKKEGRSYSDRQPKAEPIESTTARSAQSPKSTPATEKLSLRFPWQTPTQTPAKPALLTFDFHSVTLDATGKQTARKPGNATYFPEDLGNGITLDMVKIPGGTFQMGAVKGEEGASDDEFPQNPVTVKDFWMGKFVVTQEQWKTIALLPQIKTVLKESPAHFKGPNLPVESISWYEAKEFCDRLSKITKRTFDLPTEAQWEYACRAGTTTPFHSGETITTSVANFDGDYTYGKALKGTYRKTTIAADSFDPNAFGLYNMHGNVWEWCLDPWHENYNDTPKDDRVWDASNDSGSKLRLVRGGSWPDSPGYCRSAVRLNYDPALQDFSIGFRVVCLSSRGPS
jgi:formylglycine-generating enzyme required for sulfatase activity